QLNFTMSNWNTPKRITVAAVNDTLLEGTHYSRIGHTIDPATLNNFLGITTKDVAQGIAAKLNGDLNSDFKATVGDPNDGDPSNDDVITITGPAFLYDIATPYTN